MTSPTPAQVRLVQLNVSNCMDWLNHCHDYMQDVINEVYSKVSEDATQDPGQSFANELIDDLLWGISGIDFPGNAFVSAFVANLFWDYVTSPPPSLQGIVGDVWARFDKSFLQANDDLSAIYADVPGNWSKSFTNPVTGQSTPVSGFGDGSVTMPAKTDPMFQQMTDKAIANYRLNLTKYLLPKKWNVLKDPKGWFVQGGNYAWVENYLAKFWTGGPSSFHAYYFTYFEDTGGNVCPEKGISICENYMGTGSTNQFGSPAPDDLCDWLFQDDGYGRITNASGIATRHDVFCNWGLNGSLPASAPHCNPWGKSEAGTYEDQVPPGVEAERAKARAWHKLFHRTERYLLEKAIVEQTRSSPVFLRNLVKEPKRTVEAFLGIQFPEGVEFEVIQETPGKFKMVIPLIGGEPTKE